MKKSEYENKFEFVMAYLKDLIQTLEPNEKLPSERDLIEALNLSRPTIQKAITELEKEGYLYKIKRQGTFVADRKLYKSLNVLQSFSEEVKSMGEVPSTQLISFEIIKPNEVIAKQLQVSQEEFVYRIVRVRYKNDSPVILDNAYFPTFVIEGIKTTDLNGSIYGFIKSKGYVLRNSEQIIDAVIADEDVTELLQLDQGQPVIKVDMTSYLQDGRPFEYSVAYKNPKKYTLFVNASTT